MYVTTTIQRDTDRKDKRCGNSDCSYRETLRDTKTSGVAVLRHTKKKISGVAVPECAAGGRGVLLRRCQRGRRHEWTTRGAAPSRALHRPERERVEREEREGGGRERGEREREGVEREMRESEGRVHKSDEGDRSKERQERGRWWKKSKKARRESG